MPAPRQGNKCRYCGAPLIWVKSVHGRVMPLNAKTDPTGNIVIKAGIGHVVTENDVLNHILDGERYTSHFATCPKIKRAPVSVGDEKEP